METNYRVYAYTTSAVEMEILRLFTRPDYRLPNLYVGMLTRESVHQALGSGCGPGPRSSVSSHPRHHSAWAFHVVFHKS